MNTNTKPVASLGALLAAITEVIAAAEQRILATLDGIENRVVGLEDKITKLSTQTEGVHDDLVEKLGEVREMVKESDTSAVASVMDTLDELADAERRRELNEIRADVRVRRAS